MASECLRTDPHPIGECPDFRDTDVAEFYPTAMIRHDETGARLDTSADPEVTGGRKMVGTSPLGRKRFCWKCGLEEGEDDLAGCTMDILADHDLVDPESRPYTDFTFDELTARHRRAVLKARSALIFASHLERCPAAGEGDLSLDLYRQKAIKRFRLAGQMYAEIGRRIHDAASRL